MGLHTWFYNKVDLEKFNLKDMVKILVDELEIKINFFEEFINIHNKEENGDINSILTIEETLNRYKNIHKFLISDNRKRKRKLIRLYEELFDEGLVYKNELYISVKDKEYTDCFRSWNKHKPLESLEETFILLSKYGYGEMKFDENSDIISNVIDIQKIINFWKNYPNGLICFI